MDEKRAGYRLLCSELVDVSWTDHRGRLRKGLGNMEEISHSGTCLFMDEPIPCGSVLRMLHYTVEFQGLVRYCQHREFGYFLGVEFFAGCRRRPAIHQAEHLVDVRTLADRRPKRTVRRSSAGSSAKVMAELCG
jgi:hypothetical protein